MVFDGSSSISSTRSSVTFDGPSSIAFRDDGGGGDGEMKVARVKTETRGGHEARDGHGEAKGQAGGEGRNRWVAGHEYIIGPAGGRLTP